MARISDTTDLTTGKPAAVILRFALPIFLSQLFQQLYNSVDSLIVGNVLGKQALAAVSSSGSLIFMIVGFFTGAMMGAGVVISRHFGAGDEKQVDRAIHTTIAAALLVGAIITVFGMSMTPTILRWMGTAEEVMPHSVSYFRMYFAGGLAISLYNACNGIMTALGDSRRPLIYLIVSSCLNVVLDLLFVALFHWGVGSAAVATSISQAVSVLLCLRHLTRPDFRFRLRRKSLRIYRSTLLEVLRNGIPAGVQNSVISLANVLVQTNINSFGGDAMAGCGAFSRLEGFVFLPITCFSMALSTFISQNLGARQHARAKKGARFAIIASCAGAELIGAVTILFGSFLVGLFNRSPEIVAIGVQQIAVEAPFFFLLAFDHCIAGICRGAGKATVPMGIMLSIWCVLRIAYITVAMHIRHEIHLLFWAYPITWGISAVMFLLYYLCSDWVHGFDRATEAN